MVIIIWIISSYLLASKYIKWPHSKISVEDSAEIITKSEAANIESFFQVFGDSLAILAQLPSIESPNSTTLKILDTFRDQWLGGGLVGGVVLTDSEGIVRYNSNSNNSNNVGISLTDRDYFQWAKNNSKEGEYLVGRTVTSRLGATKGEIILPVASPVYLNGKFTGVVAASVKLKALTTNYLKLIKMPGIYETYIVDKDGLILFSGSEANTFGTNIATHVNQGLEEVVKSNKGGTKHSSGKLITYAPINLSKQNWMIITVVEKDQFLKVSW